MQQSHLGFRIHQTLHFNSLPLQVSCGHMLQEHTNLCNIFEQEHGHFITKGCTPLATFLLLPWTFLYIAAMRLSPAPFDFKEASPGKDQATDLDGSS